MSIKPPSDIVLDVARAADPVKRDLATRKLAAAAGGETGAAFASLVGETQTTFGNLVQFIGDGAAGGRVAPPKSLPEAMKGLETFFLRTAFETMLPDSPRTPGFAGAGAGVWKSMLADALANTVAASGGLGILPGAQTGPAARATAKA